MFIAKTTLNKNALVALQKQMNDASRTNDNDLVALEYVFDVVRTSDQILRSTSLYDDLIRYVFFWAFEHRELILYQHIGITIYTHSTKKNDGTPIWGCYLEATLHTWIEYCESDHPKQFIKIVRDKLVADGYSLRLGRNLCQQKLKQSSE